MNDNYRESALWNDKPESWKDVMPGVKRRVVSHSPTGMLVYYEIKAGTIFPSHDHPHAQFGMVLQGEGSFKVGDKTWNMKKGDGYFIPPGVTHELKTLGSETFIVMDFFTPERADFLNEVKTPDE